MNHKIIFNQNTSAQAEDNEELNRMVVTMVCNYINDLLKVRGYIYLNQIYEYFGVKWNIETENHCLTSKYSPINFVVRNTGNSFEIIF